MTDDDDPPDPSGDDDWYGDADPRVPDASAWPDRDLRFLGDDVYLGEQAQIAAEPPAAPPRDPAAEIRELERRLEQQRTPVFPIDLRRRLPLEAVWRRWRALAMWGRSDVVDDFGRDPRATARWEWLFEFLYSRWFRVEASGLEHIPDRGRALLVANHAGSLPYDSAMVMHAVRRDHPARRDVRPLVEDTVFHLPFLGPIMNRIGGVRADPENAERLLAEGRAGRGVPRGREGHGQAVEGPLPPAAVRPRRVRQARAAHRRADHPGRRGRRRGGRADARQGDVVREEHRHPVDPGDPDVPVARPGRPAAAAQQVVRRSSARRSISARRTAPPPPRIACWSTSSPIRSGPRSRT